jgi:diguanylate cyclase (GGDEF)-like protein/PAS domain S-box-containing protein
MPSRRAFGLLAVAVALVCAVSITDAAGLGRATEDLAPAAAAFLAAVLCRRTARRAQGRTRAAWYLFATAGAAWGAGEMVWSWYELVAGRQMPFPSAADVGFLLAVPALGIGSLLLVRLPSRPMARARMAFDLVIILNSLGYMLVTMVTGPVLREGPVDLSTVLGLIYPTADVIACAVLFTLVAHGRAGARWSLSLLAGALLCLAVADATFVLEHSSDWQLPADDVMWLLGFGLIAVAAGTAGASAHQQTDDAGMTMASILLPYLPIVAAATLLGAELAVGGVDTTETWLLAVVAGAVAVRQLVTLVDNASLTREIGQRERYFRSLVQNSSDCVSICDEFGQVRYESPSAERIFGWSPTSRIGGSWFDVVHDDDRERVLVEFASALNASEPTVLECRLRHADGEWLHVETMVNNLLGDDSVQGVVLNSRDVTERQSLEEALTYQAFHDSLTGLANRALFAHRVQHALDIHQRDPNAVGVVLLDLDGFKAANDSLGHSLGDALLVETGRRLVECVRPGDTVARLGGDEFAVLLEPGEGEQEIRIVAERFIAALAQPFRLHAHEVFVSASVGYATGSGGDDAEALLRNADLAMYRAKTAGKGRVAAYASEMHAAVLERVELENDLRHAIERNELVVHYQPIVDLDTMTPIGVEALARWQHPRLGLVPPGEFIGVAEDSGLIVPIGRWVLEEACRQVRRWENAGCERVHLSVNISARELAAPRLAEHVARTLRTHSLDPAQLSLEITETILVEDTERTLAKLGLLRELGVGIALDDFGTGYSSLAYLRRMPVTTLKIDRSFVSDVGDGGDVDALAGTVVDLARSLRLATVAEGIENEDQLVRLRAMGCTYGQGFLFSRPVPADEAAGMLRGRPLVRALAG